MFSFLTIDRHVFGKTPTRENCFDNLKVTRSAWDTNLIAANAIFVSINLESGGGGSFAVLAHAKPGKVPDTLPVFNGHGGAVLDTDFNPFNDYVVASASEVFTSYYLTFLWPFLAYYYLTI
jgi:coronin-1B/1C/6